MRKSIIDLDDGVKVEIREISPRSASSILNNAKEIFEDPNLDVMKFISEKFDLVVDLTKPFIKVKSKDKEFDIADLGFSDIDKIITEFKVVNQSFLDKLSLVDLIPTKQTQQTATETDVEPTKEIEKV